MLIKVFCVVSMLSKLPPAVCFRGGGGGGGGATGLLNKGGGEQQASCLVVRVLCVICVCTSINDSTFTLT